jgi:hypothetical protein
LTAFLSESFARTKENVPTPALLQGRPLTSLKIKNFGLVQWSYNILPRIKNTVAIKIQQCF